MDPDSGVGRQGEALGLPPNPYNPLAWIVGKPQVGEGTWIGAFTVVDGSGGLTIGRGCDISSGVHIYTHSSAKRCVSTRAYSQVDRMPVTIGDYVFIGANATVNMGVTIGDHALHRCRGGRDQGRAGTHRGLRRASAPDRSRPHRRWPGQLRPPRRAVARTAPH